MIHRGLPIRANYELHSKLDHGLTSSDIPRNAEHNDNLDCSRYL